MIFQQLEDRGFTITSKTHPFTVEKGGRSYQVGVRRARMDGANILVESASDLRDEIVALVFESVRLVTPEQMQNMTLYTPQAQAEVRSSATPHPSPSVQPLDNPTYNESL
jgi:hypothetical protein